jgi:hypothetical protein
VVAPVRTLHLRSGKASVSAQFGCESEPDHVGRPREPLRRPSFAGLCGALGSSLGTAIIGAVLLASLATGFSERIADNDDIPAAARETIVARADEGIDIVPVDAAEQAAVKGGLTQDQARAVAADYGEAQLDALRLSLGAVALAALLSLWFTRRLPTESLAQDDAPATEPAAVLSGSAP